MINNFKRHTILIYVKYKSIIYYCFLIFAHNYNRIGTIHENNLSKLLKLNYKC